MTFYYLFHLKSSAVACRHWLFLECQWISWQLALESSFWGKQVKNSLIFTVDFVGHKKQFLSWQYPNIGLIKLGGGRGGLGSDSCSSLSSLNSGSVWKSVLSVAGVGTCMSGVQPPSSWGISSKYFNMVPILGGHSFLALRHPPSFHGRLYSFNEDLTPFRVGLSSFRGDLTSSRVGLFSFRGDLTSSRVGLCSFRGTSHSLGWVSAPSGETSLHPGSVSAPSGGISLHPGWVSAPSGGTSHHLGWVSFPSGGPHIV